MAFGLLGTLLGVATPLVVRHSRLQQSQCDYRLALEELSNQLARISIMSADERSAGLDQLTPSDFVGKHLTNVKLQNQREQIELGERITLKITWNDGPRSTATQSLAAWYFNDHEPSAGGAAP